MAISLDYYDLTILTALEKDGALTNVQLSALVNLSASQCSRRRARLEAKGVIAGYQARLNPVAMGLQLRAVVRINLASHSESNAADFAAMLASHREIEEAFSVSGDADYVLIVRCETLEHFADFIHERLLPQKLIAQVRSEIVLRDLKR